MPGAGLFMRFAYYFADKDLIEDEAAGATAIYDPDGGDFWMPAGFYEHNPENGVYHQVKGEVIGWRAIVDLYAEMEVAFSGY